MKILRASLFLSTALFVAAPALANQVQVGSATSAYGPYQTGVGGEFTLTALGNWLDVSDYVAGKTKGVSGAVPISSFQTFCLEYNEHIYPNPAMFDVTISDKAVKGGVGGGNPDPLSKGTAYLYSLFAQGTLAGYNYNGGRTTSAAALQQAIWWLEDEITLTATQQNNNAFLQLLLTPFTTLANAKLNAYAGQYGVSVLNLTNKTLDGKSFSKGDFQSQLYYNVPDAGTTLSLAALGMLALGALRRRLGKN